MTKIIDSFSEFRAWIDVKIAQFVGTGLWAEEACYEIIKETRANLQFYCPDKLDLIPDLDEHYDISDEQLRALRTLVIDKLQYLKDVIAEELTSKPETNPIRSDGPFPPDGFRWQGKEFRGLSPLPWRLVDYLWLRPEQCAHFNELAEPVWQDHEVIIDSNNFGSPRRDANKWLKANKLPFTLASKSNRAFLKKI